MKISGENIMRWSQLKMRQVVQQRLCIIQDWKGQKKRMQMMSLIP